MGNERPSFYERLRTGLEDGVKHARGEIQLRTFEVTLPDPPGAYDAFDVKRIRTSLRLSQPGFARLLAVSAKTVQSWEQGTRRPSQAAARLLQFIENPDLLNQVARHHET